MKSVKIIPPKDDRALNRSQKAPEKLRILTYALVTKGGRTGVQIKKM